MNKLILTLMCVLSAFTVVWGADGDTFIQGDLKFTVVSESDRNVVVGAANEEISGDISIPSTVTNGNTQYAVTGVSFRGCTKITSVVIPNSVTKISGRSFFECINMTSVEIPNSVVEIADYAFYCCFSLTSVVVPNSVISIGEGAFGYCVSMEYAVLGNSVEFVHLDAFIGCSRLKKKAYPNTINNPFEKSHPDYGRRYNIAYDPNGTMIENGWIYGHNRSEIIFAPPTIIGDYVIPDSVESIDYYAFGACASLTSVEIGNSVTSISSSAFMDCEGLTSIEIPESLTSIENSVFWGCKGLKSISLPNSLTSIGDGAFLGSGLTSVDLPNSVTSIGKQAFYYCSELTSLIIPSFITSIGDGAFDYCPNLTDVYYGAEFPDEFISGEYPLFDSSTYSEATLWVPEKAVEQCRQIEPWKYFDNIKAYDFGNLGSSIDGILSDSEQNILKSVDVYDLKGTKVNDSVEKLSPGIYITRMGKVVKKIFIH